MILGTAGHIDHGKTTLVRALTGVDTDRLPEEKKRGITIELGFAPLVLPGVGTLGVVDVPGHEAFVRTMLAGATGIDLALLVIAADEGVMPQTREHLAILSLLAVRGGVVALTKSDLVEDEWLALVTEDVRTALDGSPLADAPIVPVSSVSGAGLDALRDALAEAASKVPARDPRDLFRMPIDRSFSVKGTGTVVTGTVWSGSLASDATVRIMPSGRVARVRGIQSHGASSDRALPGTRVALSLAGVERDDAGRGSWVVTDAGWAPTRILRADVALLDDAPTLGPRTRVRLHLGTQDVGARVVAAGGALAAGELRGTRVVLDEPLLARAGDRFVLRLPSPATTIGGGVVADPFPPARRAHPWAPGLTVAQRVAAMLDEAGAVGLEISSVAVRAGASPGEAAAIASNPAHVTVSEGRVASRGAFESLVESAAAAVREHHQRFPLDDGAPLAALRAAVGATTGVFDAVLRELVGRGSVTVHSAVARAAGWAPALDAASGSLAARLLDALAAAEREPPSVGELAAALGADPRPVLRFLEREGRVVAVGEDRYYLSDALGRMVAALAAGMAPGRVYTPAELRDLLGLSRKYLIPFLEHCDQRGITVRADGGRRRAGT
ncbi:MAG TPA: selenocysteine-specific translation elongation factor [Gemmatimonadaceae bacterium]